MACAAKTEEAEFVVNYAKLARVSDPPTKAGQIIVGDGTSLRLLNSPATLADQEGMMAGELLSQFIPKSPAGGVHSPQEPRRHQKVDGPVDGDAVDALLGHSGVNLLDRKRAIARADYLQDGAARLGQAVALSGEQVMKRAPRSNRC